MQSSSTSMLAGLNCHDHIHLIIGINALAASRCAQSLNAGAIPILVAPAAAELHYGLRTKVDAGSVRWVRKDFEYDDLLRLGRDEVGRVVDAVFVTTGPRDGLSTHISQLCKQNRIPVNVIDAPHLCTFTLLSTHTDGPLQIGVTTNGRGCKLASRIRREIAASLPSNLGAACGRLGNVRRALIQQDATPSSGVLPKLQNLRNGTANSISRLEDVDSVVSSPGELDDSLGQDAFFNQLVVSQQDDNTKIRRIRWLSQICEYWPLSKLASVTEQDMDRILQSYPGAALPSALPSSTSSTAQSTTLTETETEATRDCTVSSSDNLYSRPGRLILAGSGPGHPDLLTQATHKAILTADIILADKLVPSGVLDLIPRRTPVEIARKFPGNADKAQEELLESALQGVRQGKTVLRLKQGDPFIYGRGGEEVAFFREKGFGSRVSVLPGITSSLSAPLFAAIPPTQRDVADQVLICTGTGKKGAAPVPPEYVPSRTTVFLMALHRISGLVRELTTHVELDDVDGSREHIVAKRSLWPLETPCAVIERASCPDQRVIRTNLAHVVDAIEAEGSRPPGLLIAGNACSFLHPALQSGPPWSVEEGFRGLDGLGDLVGAVIPNTTQQAA